MRSLFWKIFLSFWLAMTLIMAAFGLIYVFDVPYARIKKFDYITRQAIRHHGKKAVELFERGGEEALRKGSRGFYDSSKIQVFLFHESVFLGGPARPSKEVLKLARSEAPDGRKVELEKRGVRVLYFVEPLYGSGKGGYKAVGVTQRPTALMKYLSPRTLPFRMLVMFLVTGLICYVLARYFTRSIQHLRNTTQRLAEGDLDARVNPSARRGGDEIAALGRDFDKMAERLCTLMKAQNQLVRDISHELRSPLARLNVALGLARQKSGEEALRHLNRIEREAERLNDLIGELITLSLLESGSRVVEMQPVDLVELLEEVVRDADYEARQNDRRVAMKHETASDRNEPLLVLGQPELLRRAVENVLRNAIRFTEKDTEVELQLETEAVDKGRQAMISVRDHGPGIPESRLSQIFEPFSRVEDARDRRTGGTGIGLAITQRAVKLHGGSVLARNAPDKGLIVHMSLPLASADNEQRDGNDGNDLHEER